MNVNALILEYNIHPIFNIHQHLILDSLDHLPLEDAPILFQVFQHGCISTILTGFASVFEDYNTCP